MFCSSLCCSRHGLSVGCLMGSLVLSTSEEVPPRSDFLPSNSFFFFLLKEQKWFQEKTNFDSCVADLISENRQLVKLNVVF